MLPVVWYGRETWSLTMREKRRLKMFESRILRRLLEPNRGEVTGEWKKLNNEEHYNLHSSSNIIWVITSKRMRWAGHIAYMGERKDAYKVLVGNMRERDYLYDPGVDGRIILRWIFRNWDRGRAWTGLLWLRRGTGGGLL